MVCIFTNAQNRYWSGVVTQVKILSLKDGAPLVEELDPEQLSFLSGEFVKASLNWNTYEKEVFEILYTFKNFTS